MDMEYYRNFIAIVESGSLSAASKRVHVAQPALSNQLKLLQKKFGTQLVNIRRGVHNIELTNAGCILYNKAKYICSLEDDTQREISDSVHGYTGTLRISLSPSMSISFIRSYLSKFSKEYPQINYELYEVTVLQQTEQMLSGQTEIGVANAPLTQEGRFDVLYTKQERLVAVMHKENPWLPIDDEPVAFRPAGRYAHLPVPWLFASFSQRLLRLDGLSASLEHQHHQAGGRSLGSRECGHRRRTGFTRRYVRLQPYLQSHPRRQAFYEQNPVRS